MADNYKLGYPYRLKSLSDTKISMLQKIITVMEIEVSDTHPGREVTVVFKDAEQIAAWVAMNTQHLCEKWFHSAKVALGYFGGAVRVTPEKKQPRKTDGYDYRTFRYRGNTYRASEIADIVGKSRQLVTARIKAHGVDAAIEELAKKSAPLREFLSKPHTATYPVNTLYHTYTGSAIENGVYTSAQLAQILSVDQQTIRYNITRHGVNAAVEKLFNKKRG